MTAKNWFRSRRYRSFKLPSQFIWTVITLSNTFLGIFYTDKPEEVFAESCMHSKPGCDKIVPKGFHKNIKEFTKSIPRSITNKSFKFTRFEYILKPKRHFQYPRVIYKCTIRDKMITKLLTIHLSEYFKKKGVKLSKTRSVILEKAYEYINETNKGKYLYNHFLKLDISSFFSSIDRNLLFSKLRALDIDSESNFVIQRMVENMDFSLRPSSGKGIPQGIPVCSLLAELYLYDFDNAYTSKALKQKAAFIRYVDDIIVFTDSIKTLKNIKNELISKLSSNYFLSVNTDKVLDGELDNDEFEYLGIEFKKRKIYLSENQKKRILSFLTELFKWYRRYKKYNKAPFKKAFSSNPLRLAHSFVERLNLFITGYSFYSKSEDKLKKYGWILTSVSKDIEIDALKELDTYVSVLTEKYISDPNDKIYINSNKKSFFVAFIKNKYNTKDNYIIDVSTIKNDENLMYKITCNLSMVDIKYGLNYNNYEKKKFEEEVDSDLYSYFRKSLYISNRELNQDLVY